MTPGCVAVEPGQRVVVRRRLSPQEAAQARSLGQGAVWTDIIALVVSSDLQGLTVVSDAPRQAVSQTLTLAWDQVEALKPIPPRPVRRADGSWTRGDKATAGS